MTIPDDPNRGRFRIATWLFLRLLALVHLIAFVSFWVQLDGLVGPHGILPAARYFAAVREQVGPAAYYELPSLCWIFGSGAFLHVLCATGVVASLLLLAGVAPPVCLALLWAGYLTVCSAGQVFFNFQWDALLLEVTLLAIFVAPWSWLPPRGLRGALSLSHGVHERAESPRLARLLLWWLLWRLMFLGGIVKLTSGDSSWRDFSALTFHFETQPLPTPLAWYAHQLPAWWHRAECAGMFVLELFVPFFLFGPRALRHNAALLLAAFMAAIALTGNYTFFNLLAVVLCLTCLDDAWWERLLRVRPRLDFYPAGENPSSRRAAAARAGITGAFAVLAFGYTALQAIPACLPAVGEPPGFAFVQRFVAPTRSFNNYGLFAVMTRPRPELIFEGSDDGRDWKAYEFPHKPGDLSRRPTWVAPHQPRLDWQLWFAALGSIQQNPWCLSLCEHLLRGTPEVLALLGQNPFPGKPPRYVRIVRYEYQFTDAEARQRSGQWWRRTPLEVYLPPASLRESGMKE